MSSLISNLVPSFKLTTKLSHTSLIAKVSLVKLTEIITLTNKANAITPLTILKVFLLPCCLLIILSSLYGEDKIIYGIPGSSTATIDIPKAYAGKEGQIVFIVSEIPTCDLYCRLLTIASYSSATLII